ncbi:hypothetical protein [Halobacterium noricense]|uniref:hypothetical protein n=1 Tax=Halobacterium noricense TaxID=223182 RepID=UPI00338CDA5C
MGSVLPLLPSGLLSLAGVLVYWWTTGEPGFLLLAVLASAGIQVVLTTTVFAVVAWLQFA